MNGNTENPFITGTENILKAYHEANEKMVARFNVRFKDVFLKAILVAQYLKATGSREFLIAVIYTDGLIIDLKDTLEGINYAGELPLTFIIVGIGTTNFEQMDILDGDEVPRDRRGYDIVKFANMKTFLNYIDFFPFELMRKVPSALI